MFKRHLTLKVNEHSPSRVWAKQNDTGRELEVTLTDGMAAINLSGASVTLSACKPDGRQVFISGTAAGNCVKFALTNQLLSVPGIIESEINVYKDGQRLTSARFDISVESSVQSDDAVESRDDFSAVTDALGKLGNFEGIAVRADAAAERAQTAADKAQSAAAQAEQAAEGAVPDNSISGLKLQDAVCNLLDLSKCTPQVISTDGTGAILDDTDYVLTDFIPCVPGEKYYCPGGNRRRGVWLDKNKALIKYESYGSYGAPGVITAPDNAAFLRLSYGATSYDNVAGWDSEHSMIIHGGDGYPDTYIAYGNAKADWLRAGLDNGSVTENIVSDRAITPGKIADAVINLLDLTKCTPQCIGAGEDDFGSILDDNNFVLTDYIPCSPGQEIWYPGGNRRRINYYDKNLSRIKTEIRGTWANPDKITVPDNAAYLRWSCGAVEYDGVAGWDPKYSMITYGGNSYPSAYIPYGGAVIPWLHTSPGIKSVGTEQLKSEAVTAANMSGIITNKLNLDDITAGKLSPDDGTVTADNSYMISAYIDIPAGQVFVCPQGQDRCICYYDEQKQYLSSDAVTGWHEGAYTGTMPEGAAYLRVSYKLEGFAVWPMLCLGSTYPDKYVPYGDTVIWLDRNPLKGKKLAVLGDSLSAWYKSAISNAGYFNGMDYDRTVHNQSVWGSPVSKNNIEGTPASFVERFSLLRDTTDYLVIQGGVNDCGLNIPIGMMTAWDDFTGALDEHTFAGALESLFRQAQAKYPNAKILFFTSVKLFHMPKLGDYMDAAKLVCNKYSVPVLDLYNCSGLNQGIADIKSKYFNDDTHPNDWGHLLLTKTVERFLIDCFAPAQINTSQTDRIYSWADVQNAVRRGMGPTLFPEGYEFTVHNSIADTEITWAVRGHDHHLAADSKIKHTMTLETKNVYSTASGACQTMQFDAPKALYYALDGLAAGTYHFEVANQKWCQSDNGKTYQFTLTTAVPAGGQVCLSMTYSQTLAGKSVKTYASPLSTEEIESATLTEGAEGIRLGATDGNSTCVNHMHRIIFGSNNYAQSAVRQWLISDAETAWTPQTKFDRPPTWAANCSGFMHGLPADFLAVVVPAVIPCRTNSTFECESLDGTEFAVDQVYSLKDKFFLLSRPEVYGTYDNSAHKDGELLEFYKGFTNAEQKKYDNGGSVRTAWLRSPYLYNAYDERDIDLNGNLNTCTVCNASGVTVACIIG